MKKRVSITGVAIFLGLFCVSGAPAQVLLVGSECVDRIYKSNEVSRPASILEPPDFSGVMNAFQNVRGRVRVEAVLCRTGRVTNIKILEAPPGLRTDFPIQAMSIISFRPAELNWHSVSQAITFEFEINEGEVKVVPPAPANSPIIEAVNVMGNRRLSAKDILPSIYSHVGEPFNEAQVKGDLKRLLATGLFDKLTTRAVTEPGVRGGLNLKFFVQELPVVGEIKFEGLSIEQFLIIEALKNIGLRSGGPYTPQTGQAGIRIIRQLLAAGKDYSRVELREEFKDSQTVNLVFVITKQ